MTFYEYSKGIDDFFSYAVDKDTGFITEGNAKALSLGYLTRSGNREISATLDNILGWGIDKTEAWDLALVRFSERWKRINASLLASYDPLENYSMSEKENIGSDVSATSSVKNGVYGFNSDEVSPSSQSDTSSTSIGAKESNERNTTRTGRTGSKTPQEMIEDEIDVRKNMMTDLVYADLDSLFVSPYWKE